MSVLRSAVRSLWLLSTFPRAIAELLYRRPRSRRDRALWLHRFCARVVRGSGIQIAVRGSFPEKGALIANHVSYLDILVLASLHPCVFVAKAEIRRCR